MRNRWLNNGYGAIGKRGCGRRYMCQVGNPINNAQSYYTGCGRGYMCQGSFIGMGYGSPNRSMRYGRMSYMDENYMTVTDALTQERAFIEQRLNAIDRQLNQDK